ncbi:MAG: OmpA family protein [Saprospirales bacterium]|nr:OmpA family protein [Saprospirales bacterium]MBK8922632.1 OmpA family protein [Saprospirales bacterium]
MTRFFLPLAGLFMCCPAFHLSAQNFRVQVAAFADSVPAAYFIDKGVNGVIASVDETGIHRYFFGSYPTFLEAEDVQRQLVTKGFEYALVVDLAVQRLLTDQRHCGYFKGGPVSVAESDSVRFVYFDPGKSILSEAGKSALEYMLRKLKEDPASELRILGYSDAQGSGKANLDLATARARATRNYLIDRDIDPQRMLLRVFGEAVSGKVEDQEEYERESEREEQRKLYRCVVLYWKRTP